MSTGESNIIDIAVDLRHETDKALLVFDGTKEVWLPKSMVEFDSQDNTVAMPEWFALQKGLI